MQRSARYKAVVIGLLFGLIMTEATLHWLVPSSTQFYIWPPGMRLEYHPNPVIRPGITQPSRFTVNAQGLRAKSFDPRNQQQFRILAIGGSTTECLYLDDSEAWPSLVEQALNRSSRGVNVWVGNAGVSGMNSRDHIVQVKHLLAEFPRIDMVVVLLGINDLLFRLRNDNYVPPNSPLSSPEAEIRQINRAFSIPPSEPWYKKTAVYHVLRIVKAQWHRLYSQDSGATVLDAWRGNRTSGITMVDQLPDLTSAVAEYQRNLNTIIDLVQAKGSRVVLMTQPTLWRADLNFEEDKVLWAGEKGTFVEERGRSYYSARALAEAMNLFNHKLLQVCESRKIDCVDLATKLPKTLEVFYDDAHFTVRGAQIVAETVSAHLAPFVYAHENPTANALTFENRVSLRKLPVDVLDRRLKEFVLVS